TIAKVLNELYDYQFNGEFRYRKYLAAHVELIDPSVETAKEAYIALRKNNLVNDDQKTANHFFITIPNTALKGTQLQPDGWFTY
ncbi:hypothetical protein ABTL65_19660, partial [Acinetobacter baumannii]